MTDEDALALIRDTMETVHPGSSATIEATSDLAALDQLDSLHLMEFLFELENSIGHKIEAIGEEYSDFRVPSLIAILKDA